MFQYIISALKVIKKTISYPTPVFALMGLGTQTLEEINLIVLNISAFIQNQLNPRPRIFKEGINKAWFYADQLHEL